MQNWIVWDMDPVAFTIGEHGIRWYGLLLATGFYLGFFILQKILKKDTLPNLPTGQTGGRQDFSEDKTNILAIYIFLGTVIGLRLGHCFLYEPLYYLSHPTEIFKVWEGGLASHGGGLGILLAVYLFCRKYKHSYIGLLDKIVIIIPLVAAIVRLGNLMNSEIYGTFTNLPWGFIFTHIQDGPMISRHPTQIYEALIYLIIFTILMFLYFKKNAGIKTGYLLGIFLILLFVSRFLIEFVKDVQVGWEKNLPLNMGQMLSIPFILFGIFLIYRAVKTKTDTKVLNQNL